MIDPVDVRAKVRYVSISPQKVRLVIDLVRGMNVVEAMSALRFEQKAAAKPVYKLLRSAVANAEENMGLSRNDLFVHTIYADVGPTRRWRRFGARHILASSSASARLRQSEKNLSLTTEREAISLRKQPTRGGENSKDLSERS